MNQIETMCAIARAHVLAGQFPGVVINPTEDGVFDILTVDMDFSRHGVLSNELVIATKACVEQLKHKYGPNAERLDDLKLDINLIFP